MLFSLGIKTGFGGAWYSDASWLDARTGGDRGDLPGSRITSRRGTHLASFSAHGGPAGGIYVYALQVHDTANPSAGWSAVMRIGNEPGGAPPATLGAQRLYYAGAATASFDPGGDVVGVRAFPLTPPAECVPPPDPRLPGLPCPLWSTPTTSVPLTSPVLSPDESILYVGTDDGTLLALDAADGHVLWSAALAATPSADPALAEGWLYMALTNRGVVFVGTNAGELVALRAAGCRAPTCRPLWRGELDGPVTGAPAVSNGRVYVGVSPDQLVAFAPA